MRTTLEGNSCLIIVNCKTCEKLRIITSPNKFLKCAQQLYSNRVNKDRVVKVADFGLARDIFDSDYYRTQDLMRPMPIKWLAVECLGKSPAFTTQSDVVGFFVLS